MKRILLAMMSLLLIVLLVGCSSSNKNANQSSERVLKNYFEALNSKDAEKLKLLSIKGKELSVSELSNIEYVKLSNIKALENDNQKYSYLRDKIVNKFELENIALYAVEFDIKYKDVSKSPVESGHRKWVYALVKDTDSMQWIIMDWGDL